MNTKRHHKSPRKFKAFVNIKVLVGAGLLIFGGVGSSFMAVGSVAAKSPTSVVGLRLGSKGYPVALVQKALQAAGFAPAGGVDGSFGAGTETQVKAFQKSKGLEQSGVIDAATAAALGLSDAAASTPTTQEAAQVAATPSTAAAPLSVEGVKGLTKGSSGAAVVTVQARLVELGLPVAGGVDGRFGTGTATAVTAYQKALGLSVSGTVDKATAQALVEGRKPDAPVAAAASPAAAPAPATSLVDLKSGSTGPVVVDLQSQLVKAGVTVRGGADGVFGPATSKALKTFQRSQGLPETGAVDEATVQALKSPKPIAQSTTTTTAGDSSGYGAYGEQSSRVSALQKALSSNGQSVQVDGQFGAKTSAAVMAFQKQNGLSVTGKIDDATAKALGLTATSKPAASQSSSAQSSGLSIDKFPVQASCGYIDTWGAARGGGRSHIGVDILAETGKEIYAVKDGTISKVYTDYPGALAGNGVRLTTSDGTYFFYAHMSTLADGIELGVPVKAGQVIGYVGSTGNAGVAHLHFEVHPGGGSAVNPYPIVKAVNGC